MIDREARRQIDKLQEQLDDLIHFKTFEVALPLGKQETKGSGGSMLLTFDSELAATATEPIIPCRLLDGILRNGKYDANLLIRDPAAETWSLGDAIWAIDLSGSSSLDASTDYVVNPVEDDQGNLVSEVGGDFVVCLKTNFSKALTDTTFWAPTTDNPASPPAWSAGTFPFGTIRTHSGSTYIVSNPSGTSGTPGSSSDWLLLSALTDEGAYDGQATYYAGNYVQAVRSLYAIQSPPGGSVTPTIATSPSTGTATGPAFTFQMGTSGSDLNIVAGSSTVTWNVPDWSTTARGVFNNANQHGLGFKSITGATTKPINPGTFASTYSGWQASADYTVGTPSYAVYPDGFIANVQNSLGYYWETTYESGSFKTTWYNGNQTVIKPNFITLQPQTVGVNVPFVEMQSQGLFFYYDNGKLNFYGVGGVAVSATDPIGFVGQGQASHGATIDGVVVASYGHVANSMASGGDYLVNNLFDARQSSIVGDSTGVGGNTYGKPSFSITYYTAGPIVNRFVGQWGTDAIGNVFSGGICTTVSTTYTGSASIVTLGTITTGTWHATPIGTAYGGFGKDMSAETGLPLFASGVESTATNARESPSSATTLQLQAGSGRWIQFGSTDL